MRIRLSHTILFGALLILGLSACMAEIDLFAEERVEVKGDNVGNFYSTHIFDDDISSELWYSPDGGCLSVKSERTEVYSGTGALHLSWDKGKGGCDWIGMGIGWANWSGKNMGQVYDRAAISFKVKTNGRPLSNLPWALGIEDHSGMQAWTGFSRKMMTAKEINGEWSEVIIPILSFNWQEFDADVSNIKQIIIQFEASGEIYMDDIRVIEHTGSLRSRCTVPLIGSEVEDPFAYMSADAIPPLDIEGHLIELALQDHTLHVMADIKDDTPLRNSNEGDKMWNGDAIELAFSSNADAPVGRPYYLSTDRQIGIRCTEETYFWNWRSHTEITGASATFDKDADGYRLRASIPLEELGIEAHEAGSIYGLEIAIDLGDENARQTQLRWNSPDVGGFYKNPSVWGEMKIVDSN